MAKPKLHIHVPSLPQRSYEYRRGDSILIYDDDKNAILIDGGERELFDQMELYLRKNFTGKDGYAHVTFVLTHWHGDHDCGLRYALESPHIFVDRIYCPDPEELKLIPRDEGYDEYSRAKKRIQLAKEYNKEIIYPPAGKRAGHWVGKIRMWMFRYKANPNDYVDYQVNNTSMFTYFPDLEFLASGDTISSFDRYLKTFPYRITGFKVPHHGNACNYTACDLMAEHEPKICYYTDWEPSGVSIGGTTFSQYGAGRTKKYWPTLRPFQDIDVEADGLGHVTWKQGENSWTFPIAYGGPIETPTPDTEAPTVPIIRENTGFKGYNVTKRKDKIEYIVIHYTGTDGATAANEVKYFNAADRQASADYFIDFDGSIYAYNNSPATQYTWHCGGDLESAHHPLFRICKNSNSIGIELCTRQVMGAWTFTEKTVAGAVALVKYLMDEFKVPADHVCRHYDVTGKSCPRVSGWGAVGGSAEWDKFKAALSGSAPAVPQLYRVRKSWTDAKSQLGAFQSLDRARDMAAAHPGWKIFDSAGNEIQ